MRRVEKKENLVICQILKFNEVKEKMMNTINVFFSNLNRSMSAHNANNANVNKINNLNNVEIANLIDASMKKLNLNSKVNANCIGEEERKEKNSSKNCSC